MAKASKTNAMRILEKAKVPYTVHTYEPDGQVDGLHVAQKLGQNPAQVYKTLVTKGKSGNYFVFVLPVAAQLDLKAAAAAVGEKSVEMIAVQDLNSVTGYIRGGCSPVGMKKAFPTVLDSSASQWDSICVSGGRIGCQIELAPQDLAKAAKARFASIAVSEKIVESL